MKTPLILKKAGDVFTKELKSNLKRQGHSNTGALEKSIDANIKGIELTGEMYDYGIILNDGVKPSRIPFKSGSGAKTSKYIDGLIGYFTSRGLSLKEAKSAAFATAKKQKQEGMSTKASSRFSKTGSRQYFIDISLKAKSKEVDKIMSDGMDDIFMQQFKKQKSETI